MNKPCISIGMPVLNGEAYIVDAINSLIAQTFDDFELLISDNASTDATEEICRQFAQVDERVKYHRNAETVGAAKNFNDVFHRATGKYFKWAAHDDVCAPTHLQECVACLDSCENAVLVYPLATVIDEKGEPIENYEKRLPTDSDDPIERFYAFIPGHSRCYEVFGLIRRATLAQTRLIGNYAHGDTVLLLELALRGQFVEVPRYLFFPRRHSRQSISMIEDFEAYTDWFNHTKIGKRVFPHWKIYLEMIRTIHTAPLTRHQRKECYKRVYWSAKGRKSLLAHELLNAIRPRGLSASTH